MEYEVKQGEATNPEEVAETQKFESITTEGKPLPVAIDPVTGLPVVNTETLQEVEAEVKEEDKK